MYNNSQKKDNVMEFKRYQCLKNIWELKNIMYSSAYDNIKIGGSITLSGRANEKGGREHANNDFSDLLWLRLP